MSAAANPSTYTPYKTTLPGMPSQCASASVEPCVRAKTAVRISSLEKNPEKGGMPAIDSVAIHINANVTGMCFRSPPMLRMSCASSWLCVA